MKRLLRRAIVVFGLLTASCGMVVGDWSQDGQVIDTETWTPLPGALVIVEWTADIGGPVQSSAICYHLEVAVADENGRYHIPAWHRRPVANWEGGIAGLNNIQVSRRAYKAGFAFIGEDPRLRSTLLTAPFRGTPEQRVTQLAYQGTRGCGAHDGSRVQELVLWKAICQEARQIPLARQPQAAFHDESLLQLIRRHQALIAESLQQLGTADTGALQERCDAS